MRALLVTVLLLSTPAAAAAAPLDADRTFGRNGVFLRDQPVASYGVVALRGGGTLHATHAGLLRLSARGRAVAAPPLQPAGSVSALLPGIAVGAVHPVTYGEPAPLAVWRLRPDGTPVAHHAIRFPGGRSGFALQMVRRGGGFAVLARTYHEAGHRSRLMIAALAGDGTLDAAWGHGGFRAVGSRSASIGGGADGAIVIATDATRHCVSRRVRPAVRVVRLGGRGQIERRRTHVTGRKQDCTSTTAGEIDVDRRGRITVAGGFGRGGSLLRLRSGLRRDRRFGREGLVRLTTRDAWWSPMALERRPRGGFGVGYTTTGEYGIPHAHVGLVGARGRRVRTRRLRETRAYPSSQVHDVAFDRRRRLVAAGTLRDTDFAIREDYGQPHLAVWRVRTR